MLLLTDLCREAHHVTITVKAGEKIYMGGYETIEPGCEVEISIDSDTFLERQEKDSNYGQQLLARLQRLATEIFDQRAVEEISEVQKRRIGIQNQMSIPGAEPTSVFLNYYLNKPKP